MTEYISPVVKIDDSIPFALTRTWQNSLSLMVCMGIPWIFLSEVIPLLLQYLPTVVAILGYAQLASAAALYCPFSWHAPCIAFTYLIAPIVNRGMINIALKVYDGKPFGIRDFFWAGGNLWQYYLGSLLYALTVLLGLACLILPGVIWGIKFTFFDVYIVDKGANASTALRASAKLTDGQKVSLFTLYLQLGLLEVVGSLCIIGMLPAQILSALARVYAYKKCMITHPDLEPSSNSQCLSSDL